MSAVRAHPGLWSALRDLAGCWGLARPVAEMQLQLPRNAYADAATASSALAKMLQEVMASARGLLHPLALGSRIPYVLGQNMMPLQTNVDDGELERWLGAANAVEMSHRATLAWYRSRLAGYPLVRAPQLVSNSPSTTLEYTSEFIWTPEERHQNLQFAFAPQGIARLLGGDIAWRIGEASRAVLAELERSEDWVRFSETHAALDGPSRLSLWTARRELKARLADRRIDNHEPQFALPRSEFRTRMVAEVVAGLRGPAQEYAEAFGAVQAMLELCVTDFFGELVAYGEPRSIRATHLDFPSPAADIVEFTAPEADPITYGTGQLLWLEGSMVEELVRVEAMTMSFDNVDGVTVTFRARVLDGTREAWQVDREATRGHTRPGSTLLSGVVS